MSLFDSFILKVNPPRPPSLRGIDFRFKELQTKDLDCNLDVYLIDEYYNLLKLARFDDDLEEFSKDNIKEQLTKLEFAPTELTNSFTITYFNKDWKRTNINIKVMFGRVVKMEIEE